MERRLPSHLDGMRLLEQLELILECDDLIDEVGFVHSSQFAALEKCSDGMKYDELAFWYKDHKLAISTEVLPQLYRAALDAYMDLKKRCGTLITLSAHRTSLDDPAYGSDSDHFLESAIQRHTRALLILNCDCLSAWNSRKLIISRRAKLSLFEDELRLCMLILSYSPKSEHTWSHRQWVIKMFAQNVQNLHDIVGRESELVLHIAEKSKMNYRAWRHRCWLIPYMTRIQVLDEFYKSRKWCELHVADHCCFHFHQRLMLKLLEDKLVEEDVVVSAEWNSEVRFLWKEELEWNESMIKHYIGREALWIHRRFLSQCWIKHFTLGEEVLNSAEEDKQYDSNALGVFLDKELQLFDSFRNMAMDGLQDIQAQKQHAASYIMWILKQIPRHQVNMLHCRLREVEGMKAMIMEACPQRTLLWENILNSLPC